MTARMVYRVSEVAELLGLSDDTVYDLIRAGTLRARQQRRYIVVTQDDLAAYVNALPVRNAPAEDDAASEPIDLPARRVRGRQRVTRLVSPFREVAR